MVPTDLAAAASVAILVEHGPRLRVLGSGTLFCVGEESFVVTAAHVMAMGAGQNLRLALNQCQPGEIVPLIGEVLLDGRDPCDVAAVHLPAQVADGIDPKRFLRVSNVSFAEDLAEGFF